MSDKSFSDSNSNKRSKGKGDFSKFQNSDRPAQPQKKSRRTPEQTKDALSQQKNSTDKKEDASSRLNKYVANAGICSRRKADEIIADGQILVNGNAMLEPGYRVTAKDKVTYNGKIIKPQEQKIYILLNKPKNVITTLSDEKGRKSIHDIIKPKVSARVFPVGRLDRDTTGLLLITNDGDLTERLSHPSYEVKKIYHATLNKPISEADINTIKNGITLEDGFIKVDGISHIKNAPPTEVGITIHSGRNRIIRRIFEFLGYEVEKLDRVYYAGLTKKDLPRGMMRFLTKQEVIMLKHFKV